MFHTIIEAKDLKVAQNVRRTITAVAFLPVLLWHAFVLQSLWQWFVADMFRVMALTLPHAIGLLILYRFLTANEKKQPDAETPEEELKRLDTWLGHVLFWPAYTLVFGAIVRSFL